ncbi:MAG: methyltransferase [Candidatus Dormibacteria bacterium]
MQPITGVSHLLGEVVPREVRAGEPVLDMGTGCGVNALLAGGRGAPAVGVDVSSLAVAAARANARRNHLGRAVDIRQSDVFSAVEECFDLIILDPPFRWFRPRGLLEFATSDHNYRTVTKFFLEVGSPLTASGRLLVFFGTSGDLGYLRWLVGNAGFRQEVVARAELARGDQLVEYLTLRLTQAPPAPDPGASSRRPQSSVGRWTNMVWMPTRPGPRSRLNTSRPTPAGP